MQTMAFPVDYSETVDQVYIDVVELHIVELDGELTPLHHELGFAQIPSKRLPSWAPDWSVEEGVTNC